MVYMPKKKKVENRFIPLKNYYIAAFVLIAIILVTLYIFKWYEVKQSEKYRESYLVSTETVTLEINEENELKQVFLEAPEEYFVYIGYRNNKDVYNFEKDLKSIIEDYNLKDIFYYVDATDLMKDDNYIEMFNTTLNLNSDKIEKIPVIIHFKEKQYTIVKNSDNITLVADFNNLLENKGFEKIAN